MALSDDHVRWTPRTSNSDGAADGASDDAADGAATAPRSTNSALSVVGSAAAAIVVGCVVSWWITIAQRVPVRSDADLASVWFGWPIPWLGQDLSSSPFARYPGEVAVRLQGRSGTSLPTDYDWLAFAGNSLIWGAVVWTVGFWLLPHVVWLVRASRPGQLSAPEPTTPSRPAP